MKTRGREDAMGAGQWALQTHWVLWGTAGFFLWAFCSLAPKEEKQMTWHMSFGHGTLSGAGYSRPQATWGDIGWGDVVIQMRMLEDGSYWFCSQRALTSGGDAEGVSSKC